MAGSTQRTVKWARRARRVAFGAGVLSGLAAASGAGIGYVVAATLTRPSRATPNDLYTMTPFETGADYEEVTFPTASGHHIVQGWWFLRPETTRVVVGCTGYRGTKSELIGIGTALWRAGFNVLLFDYFGHGADRGAPITLAYRELQDFYAALAYVKARMPAARIGVIGFSMGASIAIMGSAHRPEVRAVVADSSFATHAEVVMHNVQRVLHVSSAPFLPIADYFLERLAGYSSRDVTPIRDIAAISPRPLLLFHGAADEIIPVEHGYQLYEAAGEPKELVIAEGAPHCGAYFLNRSGYCEKVARFFACALAEPDADAQEPSVSIERAAHRDSA